MSERGESPQPEPAGRGSAPEGHEPELELSEWGQQFHRELGALQSEIRELNDRIQWFEAHGNEEEAGQARVERTGLMHRRLSLIESVTHEHWNESLAIRSQLGISMQNP